MSDTDSFINEVTEEVRRDRLFTLMRRYGWIAILAIVLLVGGAAYREWYIASQRAEAQAVGDQLIGVLEADATDAQLAAIEDITTEGERQVIVDFLRANALLDAGDRESALDVLESVSANQEIAQVYRDLAVLKYVTAAPDTAIETRRDMLLPIATPGRRFRLVAEEQLAVLDIEAGDIESAIARYERINADFEASAPLKDRATQMIVALGGASE